MMSLISFSRATLFFVGIAATMASTFAYANEPLRLDFGVYSSNKPSAMVKIYRPILKELEVSMSASLNREVDIRMQIAKDYDEGISHLVNGGVDFSAFGPAPYVEAKQMNENIDILAVEKVKDSKVFYGIIAVAQDSPIHSVAELKGKSFAFGNEGSTIGRYLSQLELAQSGIHAGDLSHFEYLGRHDKVGTAVGAGSFDAGALNEITFTKLLAAGEPIRELVRFPNAANPWIARSGLDEDIYLALRTSLLAVDDPVRTAGLNINGFLEGHDDDYEIIRQAIGSNQAFFTAPVEAGKAAVEINTHLHNTTGEPAMQAATSQDHIDSDHSGINDPNSAVESHAHEIDNGLVTLNITLPKSLVQDNDGSGPKGVTINLVIPEPEAEELATPATTE